MKIAIVSEFVAGYEVGLEWSYARAFEGLGHRVERVSLAHPGQRWPRGLVHFQELYSFARRQHDIATAVQAADAELVLIIKGGGVFGDTVRSWRKDGRRVINVFPDNPFEGAGVGLVARTLWDQFRAVECVFVHDRFAVAQLRQASIRSEFIRFARDPLIHSDATHTVPKHDGSARDRIVFIGNPDRERIRYLRALIDLGLGIYGQWEWARLSPQDPLAQCVRGGVQLGAAMVQRMRAARLSVNILRNCQKTAHNMRTFEIPACGTCTLSEASVGVQELFAPGREIAVFRTPEELRATARELLDSPGTVDAIARAGRARVEHETYSERASELLSTL
ncbi:MAG: hypothetical protein RL701_7496 [Pseudomonadota bacterium]|jgi:glycosyltransferase involved in cell wall biosynthesis